MDKTTRYYIPYEMAHEDAAQNGIDPKKVTKIRMGVRETTGVLVETSKEVHDEYVRFIYAEEQQSYRARKCIVKSTKTGKPIRCEGKCSECTKKPDGGALSLDQMREDSSTEMMASHLSESNGVLTDALADSFAAMLRARDPLLAEIFNRMYEMQTQQEIADAIGITKREVQTKVAAYRSILQRQVTREDIMARTYYTRNSGKKHLTSND